MEQVVFALGRDLVDDVPLPQGLVKLREIRNVFGQRDIGNVAPVHKVEGHIALVGLALRVGELKQEGVGIARYGVAFVGLVRGFRGFRQRGAAQQERQCQQRCQQLGRGLLHVDFLLW